MCLLPVSSLGVFLPRLCASCRICLIISFSRLFSKMREAHTNGDTSCPCVSLSGKFEHETMSRCKPAPADHSLHGIFENAMELSCSNNDTPAILSAYAVSGLDPLEREWLVGLLLLQA